MILSFNKSDCEFLRTIAKTKFDQIRESWVECGRWALPHRTKWLLSQTPGSRTNHHIVDRTHTLALRSYVAGFLEGNTSATRPWFRAGIGVPELDMNPVNKSWFENITRRSLNVLSNGNFYHAAGLFYYEFGVYNTGAYYIEELGKKLFFHNLVPGSYYVINNGYGEAVVLVREFSMTVKALVDTYGKNGDWSNFSKEVKSLYQRGDYTQQVNVVHIVKENTDFDPYQPIAMLNRKWLSITYEIGTTSTFNSDGASTQESAGFEDPDQKDRYLELKGLSRKPFIIGKSHTSGNFEYGEQGPTLDALGLIKSLNKKAISKDQALEQMLRPPLQGPAKLRKSYVSTAPNSYVPLDANSLAQKGLRPIFEINPAIGALIQDATDLRDQVDKLYYADFLLYLSRNPKTRTATETDAVIREQQLVIGPNLQSLNLTHNVPVVEYALEYVMDTDGDLPPIPVELEGKFIRPDFISVFAQAQKAADLPSIDQYIQSMLNVAQIDPRVLDKVNLDKYADIYEDRLFLPAGLNNPQAKVDVMRQRAAAEQERLKKLETMTQLAGAAKDVGIKATNNQPQEG